STTSRALFTRMSGSRYSLTSKSHSNARHGLGCNALAPAGEAETLGGRRLDADLIGPQPGDLRDAPSHGLAVRADLRRLAYDCTIHMIDELSPASQQLEGVGEEQ